MLGNGGACANCKTLFGEGSRQSPTEGAQCVCPAESTATGTGADKKCVCTNSKLTINSDHVCACLGDTTL